ncbi:MAG: FecR domain-containing protein, partial [Burkholderiales bacterium]|nr:FecR domain-containing protein [Burkholderiales bacterium]
MKSTTVRSYLGFAALAATATLCLLPGAAYPQAGRFIYVTGDVQIVDQKGTARRAARGAQVDEGESVVTGATGQAQARMVDGGFIAVRPNTQMKFDEYRTPAAGRSENAVISLIKGGFRSITGLIGRADRTRYAVKTPTATIGIRGTDHEPYFVPPEGQAQLTHQQLAQIKLPLYPLLGASDPRSPRELALGEVMVRLAQLADGEGADAVPNLLLTDDEVEMLAQAGAPGAPGGPVGAFDRVNNGFAEISTNVGSQLVTQNQIGNAPSANLPPVITPTVPVFFAQPPTPPTFKPAVTPPTPPAPPAPVRVVDNTASVGAALNNAQRVIDAPVGGQVSQVQSNVIRTPAPQTTGTTEQAPVSEATGQAEVPSVSGGTGIVDLFNQVITSCTAGSCTEYNPETGTATRNGVEFTVTNPFLNGQLAIDDFGLLAQNRAEAAALSVTNINAAIAAIQSAQSAANSGNGTLQGVAPVDTTQASNLIAAALGVLTPAQLATAQSQLNTATAQNALIAAAQSAGATAAGSIAGFLTTAQNALGSAGGADPSPTTPNSSFASSCPSAQACSDAAAAYVPIAQQLQAAQDFVTAQAVFNNALTASNRAAAFEQQAAGASGNAAAANGTVQTQLSNANVARTAALNANSASIAAANAAIPDFPAQALAQSNAAAGSVTNINTSIASITTSRNAANTSNTTLQAITPADTAQASTLVNAALAVQASTPALINAAQLSTAQSQLATANTQNGIINNARTTGQAAYDSIATPSTGFLAVAQNALGSAAGTLDPSPLTPSSSVASTCPSAQACADQAAHYAAAAATAQAALNFAGAQAANGNAATASGRAAAFQQQATTAATNAAAANTTVGAQLTNAQAAQPLASAAASASVTAANAAIGDIAAAAQALATNAAGSFNSAQTAANSVQTLATSANTDNTTLQGLASVSTAPATSAIATATTAIGAVPDVSALSLASDVSNAASKLTAAQTQQTAAATTAGNATGVYNANGQFRDPTYADAGLNAMNAAKTALDNAVSAIQADKTVVDTSASTLATQQGAVTTNVAAAQAQRTSAQTQVGTADTQNTNLTGAKTAGQSAYDSIVAPSTGFLALAQAAQGSGATAPDPDPLAANSALASGCASAKACSDLSAQYATAAQNAQAASNFTGAANAFNNAATASTRATTFQTGAQNALTSAQGAAGTVATQLASGNSAVSGATAAVNAAVTAAGSAQTSAGAASTAAGAAQTALNDGTAKTPLINSNATAVTTQKTTLEQQAILAQYNNPAVASAGNNFGSLVAGGKPFTSSDKVDGAANQQPNTTYVLDGAKNLVEIRNTQIQSLTFGGSPTSVSGANVKFTGTPVQNETFKTGDNNVYLGRIQGGTININDGATVYNLGNESLHWFVALQPQAGYVQNLTGTTSYTRAANTSPTDTAGNAGVLNSASLAANFTNQTVNANVNLTIASKTLDMSVNNMGISGNVFAGAGSGPGSITCSGGSCAASYDGEFRGGFAATNAIYAAYNYGIWPTAGFSDLIRGAAVFQAGTVPPLAPQPPLYVATAYNSTASSGYASQFDPSGSTYTLLGGSLTTVTGMTTENTDTIAGGTAADQGSITLASGNATTGNKILFGRWTGSTVSGLDFNGSFSGRPVLGSYFWIGGPQPGPFYLPDALANTATYTHAGGVNPVDQSGTQGTQTATLSVDFAKQAVSAGVSASVGANNWVGTANNIKLDGGSFYGSTGGSATAKNLMGVTLNSSATGINGNLTGWLFGNALDGAGFAYNFSNGSSASVAGAAAFTGSQQALPGSVPVVAALGSAFATGGTLWNNAGTLDESFNYAVQGSITNASRITTDTNGRIVGFDGHLPVVAGGGVSDIPVAYAAADALVGTPPTPGGSGTAAVASVFDWGTDAATGISWGR